MKQEMNIRPMLRGELNMLLDWARMEGWNPGIHDADAFWAADPKGFVVAEIEDRIIGAGSIVAYDDVHGFMGLFIVKPEFRGKGYGRKLWYERRQLLKNRLGERSNIGLDGVIDMQHFYAEGGFNFSRNLTRHVAKISEKPSMTGHFISLDSLPFDKVLEYDKKHFGAAREGFLKHWIHPPKGVALALLDDNGEIEAMGVLRKCMEDGYKTGPLFANTPTAAGKLFRELSTYSEGENIYLDTPMTNPGAIDIVKKYNMQEVFSCGRMYNGEIPGLPWDNIYGVSSFELG